MAAIAGLDPNLALMANFAYEFVSFCTSMIVRMPDGTIYHERNLDFDFPEQMRNITYIAQFYDGDNFVYEGVMFGGLVAMQTGYRPGAFSVTLN